MTPESTQASIIQSGDGRSRAMLAETMKMPDPIIDPATSIVASVRVIALTNPESDCGVASVETAELLMQVRKKREGVDGGYRRRFRGNPAKCRRGSKGPLGRTLEAPSVASERDGARTRSRLAPSSATASRRDVYRDGTSSIAALARCACCNRR